MTALNKQKLREAAQEEIMLRSVSDTSDAWQDEASPEAVLALLDALEAAERQNGFLREQRDEWERKAISNFEECAEMAARIEELEAQRKLAFTASNRWADKFREAEKRIAEHNFENRLLANADRDIKALRERTAELQIARDKCFLSGLKTGWEYGIADDTEGYSREIADAQAVIDRSAGIGVKGE